MKNQMSKRQRVLSFMLVLSLLIGVVPAIFQVDTEAVYHMNNAPAASQTVLEATGKLFVATDGGGMLRVVDNDLYVWGVNTQYGLGMADATGTAVSTETTYSKPTLHTYNEKFKGTILELQSTTGNCIALWSLEFDKTSGKYIDHLYSWGQQWWTYMLSSNTAGIPQSIIRTPFEWDLSQLKGNIVRVRSGSLSIAVQDDTGAWYLAGRGGYNAYPIMVGTDAATLNRQMLTLRPVAESFIDMLQPSYDPTITDSDKVAAPEERVEGGRRWKVYDILPTYGGGSCFTIAQNPQDGELHLFAFGTNNHGQLFVPTGTGESFWSNAGYPVDITRWDGEPSQYNYNGLCARNEEMMRSDPDWTTLRTEGKNSAVIDASGNVWQVGDSATAFYDDPGNMRIPHKVYDAAINGAKAIKTWASTGVSVILTEDNSLYAIGLNQNQFITTEKADGASITTARQVFTELSEKQTIAGVYVTSQGVMVVTASGETFYAGSNYYGTAGNGKEGVDASDPPGTVNESVQPGLPPVQPSTANEMLFEIETADGLRYRYNPLDAKKPVTKIKADNSTETQEFVELNAGSINKLNVYFNDFGKLNGWVVPIRFDPMFIQIVNGAGTIYAKDRIVTPGALGESVGIVKSFTDRQWSGGVMVGANVRGGGYPKVCNGEGWVSVAGYTENTKAFIDGEVKMFSVYFVSVQSMDTKVRDYFRIATETNAVYSDEYTEVDCGYDRTGMESVPGVNFDHGAGWLVTNTNDTAVAGNFLFVTQDKLSPPFHCSYTNMSSLKLNIYTPDGTAIDAVSGGFTYHWYDEAGENSLHTVEHIGAAVAGATGQSDNGVEIPYTNKSAIYTIQTNYAPDNTSFPEVDWAYEILEFEKPESTAEADEWKYTALPPHKQGTVEKEDLITVLNLGNPKMLRFQIASAYPDVNAVIKFTATTQKTQNGKTLTADLYVHLKSYPVPKAIEIDQKGSLTDNTVTYKSITNPTETTTFTASFPGLQAGSESILVNWLLYDNDNNLVNSSDAAACVVISQTNAAKGKYKIEGYSAPSVVLNPQHTTFGNASYRLRVESAYNPDVYDEILVKVHQYATKIEFTQDTLYMSTDTSRNLRDLVKIAPVGEVYDTNLVWSFTPHESGPYLNFNGTSSIVSGTVASRVDHGEGADPRYEVVFDRISVRDTLSDVGVEGGKELKIAVIDVESPIKADSIIVHNLLGDKADFVRVYGLEPDDVVVLTKTYMTESGNSGQTYTELLSNIATGITENKIRRYEVTAALLDGGNTYDFPLPEGFLNSSGGDIGFIVCRKMNKGDALPKVYDKVPVSYGTEPSKVYGYVRLAGKSDTSDQNIGIRIQLIGLSNPEPIYTKASNGYFEFQEYIIPGSYTMVISKDHYLKRVIEPDAATGYQGITVIQKEEFAISTSDDPIYLYPGDLDGNGGINSSDINSYVREWFGQSDPLLAGFETYNFYDSAYRVIDLNDLDYITRHNGWTKSSYPNWTVPNVK